jgi:hypothetical protein
MTRSRAEFFALARVPTSAGPRSLTKAPRRQFNAFGVGAVLRLPSARA